MIRLLHLPPRFRASNKPIWISKDCKVIYTLNRNSDSVALRNAGFLSDKDTDSAFLLEVYKSGYVRLELLPYRKYTVKDLTITLYEPSIQYDISLHKTIVDIIKAYQFIHKRIKIHIKVVKTVDKELKITPLISFYNIMFLKAYFYSITQRKPIE